MKKITTFILIFTSGILFASIFGILHDQITYTLSNEYYTKFKLQQFGLEALYNMPRIGAVIVGIKATWWVGIPYGLFFGLILTIGKPTANIINTLTKLYLQVAALTILMGFIGFSYSLLFIGQHDYSHYGILNNVVNKHMFLAVGMMHNFSYLGGVIGLIYGFIKLIRLRKNAKAEIK